MRADMQDMYGACAEHLDGCGYRDYLFETIQSQIRTFTVVGTALPVRALCLGLGQFGPHQRQARASCVQLYIFKTMLEGFGIPTSRTAVHDPAFTENDISFIRSFGFSAPGISDITLRELICTEPTLVFHPHLPYRALEVLLEQNWSREYLKNVVLFGTKLDGWLNDHFVKRMILENHREEAYIPRLDRCVPLFEVTVMNEFPCGKGNGLRLPEELEPILTTANRISSFAFQWIPPYRVYATGEHFWKILGLEDSTWKGVAEDEKGQEGERKKKTRFRAKL